MQKPMSCLWFDGQAEEAAHFYTSLFPNSRITAVVPYGPDGPGPEGSVMTATFEINGEPFMALNGGPEFKFNEAVSFVVSCETQEEIDRLWDGLSGSGGEEGVCGWLKDRYGLSWQIVPSIIGELMMDPDPARRSRVTQVIYASKKLNIQALKDAYEGRPVTVGD